MSNIYSFLKNVIGTGGYKFADMQEKIKKYHITGDLSEKQEQELLDAAAAGASIIGERPTYDELIQNLAKRVEALEARVKALECVEDAETDEQKIEPWKPWDGLSSKYQLGDLVTHVDKVWESTHEGQNVWEPGAVGVDERFWCERTDLTA